MNWVKGHGFGRAVGSRKEALTPEKPSADKYRVMSVLKLKIDVSDTVGDAAWREIKQFDQIQSADFGPQFGSGGRCNHPADAPHAKGEWIGAEIRLQTPLLAQYAMSHYLEQERVLDADVED
jgi:hypothetical protein